MVQIIHCGLSWKWSWISFTLLSLAVRLPEVCSNQLCILCHVQMESEGLESSVFSWGWLQVQDSDGAQRAGAKHSIRGANAASASKPCKDLVPEGLQVQYWELQFAPVSELHTSFPRMGGWSNRMSPFLTSLKRLGFKLHFRGGSESRSG